MKEENKVKAEKIIQGEIETREGSSRYLRHSLDYYTNSSLTFEPYGFIPTTRNLLLFDSI